MTSQTILDAPSHYTSEQALAWAAGVKAGPHCSLGCTESKTISMTKQDPIKIVQGSEEHLTELMQRYNLQLIAGKYQHLYIKWGHDVFQAGIAHARAHPITATTQYPEQVKAARKDTKP